MSAIIALGTWIGESGPDPSLADVSDAAVQLHHTSHSFNAQQFREASDGSADEVSFRCGCANGCIESSFVEKRPKIVKPPSPKSLERGNERPHLE